MFLSEATVKAEAYASGIAEVGAELTEAEKVQARYNVILDQTGAAQGDFERTSDSLANQQRSLAGEFENMQAEIGRALLPAVKAIVPPLTDLLGAVADLSPAILAAATAIVGLKVATTAAAWLTALDAAALRAAGSMDVATASAYGLAAGLIRAVPFIGAFVKVGDEVVNAEDKWRALGERPGSSAMSSSSSRLA